MGLSASQARLLSITKRLSNNELQSEIISNAKIRLANEGTLAKDKYIAALNATRLQYTAFDDYGNKDAVSLTFNTLMNYSALKNQYVLHNSNNQILISQKDAENYEKSSCLSEFLNCYGLMDVETTNQIRQQMFEDDYEQWINTANNVFNLAGISNILSLTSDAAQITEAIENLADLRDLTPMTIPDPNDPDSTITVPSNPNGYAIIIGREDIWDTDGRLALDQPVYANNSQVVNMLCQNINNILNNNTAQYFGIASGNTYIEGFRDNIFNQNNVSVSGIVLNNIRLHPKDRDLMLSEDAANVTNSIDTYLANVLFASDNLALNSEKIKKAKEMLKNLRDVLMGPPQRSDYDNVALEQININTRANKQEVQWYTNLWYALEGMDKSTQVNSISDADGNFQNYYVNEALKTADPASPNYQILDSELRNSAEWMQYALTNGIVTMSQMTRKTNGELNWELTEYMTVSDFSEVTDDKDLAKAEAEYQNAMNEIEIQDKKYDTKLKRLDTEHSAMKTEYDSIKNIIGKNVERSYTAFNA